MVGVSILIHANTKQSNWPCRSCFEVSLVSLLTFFCFPSAPGIRFGFTGQTVAVTFGEHTIDGTLVGYRLSGLDWQFTNVTAGGTHLFISPEVEGVELTAPVSPSTFEMRVTNWGYGVQIDSVHVSEGEELVKLPRQPRFIEFIGDSLSAGMYNSYEALSGFAYGVGQGLGNTDYSITAYPGICVSDQDCWGNTRGQSHQWFYTTDNSWRSKEIWGGKCPNDVLVSACHPACEFNRF